MIDGNSPGFYLICFFKKPDILFNNMKPSKSSEKAKFLKWEDHKQKGEDSCNIICRSLEMSSYWIQMHISFPEVSFEKAPAAAFQNV